MKCRTFEKYDAIRILAPSRRGRTLTRVVSAAAMCVPSGKVDVHVPLTVAAHYCIDGPVKAKDGFSRLPSRR